MPLPLLVTDLLRATANGLGWRSALCTLLSLKATRLTASTGVTASFDRSSQAEVVVSDSTEPV